MSCRHLNAKSWPETMIFYHLFVHWDCISTKLISECQTFRTRKGLWKWHRNTTAISLDLIVCKSHKCQIYTHSGNFICLLPAYTDKSVLFQNEFSKYFNHELITHGWLVLNYIFSSYDQMNIMCKFVRERGPCEICNISEKLLWYDIWPSFIARQHWHVFQSVMSWFLFCSGIPGKTLRQMNEDLGHSAKGTILAILTILSQNQEF